MRRRTLFLSVPAALAAGAAWAQSSRLRIGLTAVILADQAAFLTRWADYLSQRTGCAVSFVARDDYQPIHDMLFSGQIDAAWTCGYPYVRYQPQMKLLAVPMYQGQPLYQAYLIRRAPDRGDAPPISSWHDLRGKVFAYSDPLSNSGWLVAQGQFTNAGMSPRDLQRTFFAHGHRHVAEAVASGLADAGSIDGYVWETMRQQRMGAALQTQVVWKSQLHGFPPLVHLKGNERSEIATLHRALLEMKADAGGQSLLRSLNLDGFVAGTPAIFDSIRTLARSVPNSGVAA